jgi:hypothetical protein
MGVRKGISKMCNRWHGYKKVGRSLVVTFPALTVVKNTFIIALIIAHLLLPFPD